MSKELVSLVFYRSSPTRDGGKGLSRQCGASASTVQDRDIFGYMAHVVHRARRYYCSWSILGAQENVKLREGHERRFMTGKRVAITKPA